MSAALYLLDTNVVSLLDPRRRDRVSQLVDWIERNGDSLFLSAITLLEMQAGLLKLRRDGKHKRADEIELLIARIVAEFQDRVLPVDAAAAIAGARIADAIRPVTLDLADLLIAAIAGSRGLILLTRNLRHFEKTGLSVVDPVAELPPDARP